MEELTKQTPLRILMTTDTVGGVWSYSLELCKALLPFNVQFYLITTGALMQPAQKQELEALENIRVYETDFMLEWMESPWESIEASGAWLLQVESALQPDLIHLNCFTYGSLPWKAPVLMVAHSDVWSWFLSVKKTHPPKQWNEYYKRVQAGLQHAGLIIAPSNTMMNYIRTIYSVATPGKVIYNGRSAKSFHPAQKAPVVFSLGRIWDEAKNIQLLIDAAPQISCQIRLAGDNSFAGNSCTTQGTNISYLGKISVSEVAVELSVASVYVHPAKYEPFGLSVLEAALSGCALVLGDIASLEEIWKDSAMYVDTGNVNALAETINELMRNDELRLQYAERAIERAMKYSTSAMSKNYMEVYSQMFQQHSLLGNIIR